MNCAIIVGWSKIIQIKESERALEEIYVDGDAQWHENDSQLNIIAIEIK